MNKKKEKNNIKSGFTLIEIIAVIIIIGILAIVTVPSVARYISNTRKTAYSSHEESMRRASESYTIECMDGNNKDCLLPDDGERSLVYLNELIDKGYLDRLKTSDGASFCSDNLSYVEIANRGKSNYEYTACLYCGDYSSENEVCTEYKTDEDLPVCGNVKGGSTSWTNTNRTITVGCSDKTSGCIRSEFSKTFTSTTTTSTIEIADKSGNTKECPVDVYVDKGIPTCSLEVISGTYETPGWYSGEVKVALRNPSDKESGLLTYGIGTSINNRDYNKSSELTITNMGITTVIGYVKDYAGNEGVCTLDVRVGTGKPEFQVEYGYQIYPNKESYTLSNMTENNTTLKTTSTNPLINFTGLNNYKSVSKVIIQFNSSIPKTTTGTINYGTGSKNFLLVEGQNRIEVEIPKGTYNNITVKLGSLSGISYNINRIELVVGDRSNLYTNKDVEVNLVPINVIMKTDSYSFNNGESWQSESYKLFESNTNGTAKTRNRAMMVSEPPHEYIINNIDKIKPSCELKVTSGSKNKDYYYTDVTVEFSKYEDTGGSGLLDYGIGDFTTKSKTLSEDKTETYTGNVRDKAGNTNTCPITVKRKTSFTVKYDANGGNACNPANKTVTLNGTYGSLCSATRSGYSFAGWYTERTGGTLVSESSKVTIIDDQVLYAHWSECGIGTYSDGTKSTCSNCPGGYTSDKGATAESQCYLDVPAGKHVDTPGGGASNCPAGTESSGHRVNYGSVSNCTECSEGTYSTAGSTCTKCPGGYTSDKGATSQDKCYLDVPAGKRVETPGGSASNCPSGQRSSKHKVYYGNTSSCESCSAGTFLNGNYCTICPSGYTSSNGSVSITDCYIDVPGGSHVDSSGNISSCPAGTYSYGHRVYYGNSSDCNSCPAGQTSSPGSTYCYDIYVPDPDPVDPDPVDPDPEPEPELTCGEKCGCHLFTKWSPVSSVGPVYSCPEPRNPLYEKYLWDNYPSDGIMCYLYTRSCYEWNCC